MGEPVKWFDPPLSRVRSVLFVGLAVVWFSEMFLSGVESLARGWTALWQVPLPVNPKAATALFISSASIAPSKGALFVMAVFGLTSRSVSVRTALFLSMALVPPLNIAFPFRYQGFLLGPVTVATVLSTILWGSFFLFRERVSPSEQQETGGSERRAPSRWRVGRTVWLATYSSILTIMASLLLLAPETASRLMLPCLPRAVPGLIQGYMTSGTHLLAVAIACWVATVNCHRNPALRKAVTAAAAAHAGLFLVFPLRQVAQAFGTGCATSSIMFIFVPLFVVWVVYVIVEAVRGGLQPGRQVA